MEEKSLLFSVLSYLWTVLEAVTGVILLCFKVITFKVFFELVWIFAWIGDSHHS